MRWLSIYLFCCLTGISFAQDSISVESMLTSINDSISSRLDSVISTALNFKGAPYRYGGNSSAGIDCSGFVCRAYQSVSVDLPHSSSQLAKHGRYIEADSLQRGDLIFFKSRSGNNIGHVALVSKVLDGVVYIIHATTSQGVIEENLFENSYFMQRWLFNRRID